MGDLITIKQTENGGVVSARDLHQFLIKDSITNEVGRDFSNWIKEKLSYGFLKGEDYSVVEYDFKGDVVEYSKIGESENQSVRVHKRDYVLTINTAKEIAMLQRNDKGKEARKYFIECERQLKSNAIPSYQIEDPVKRAEQWILEQKEKQLLIESNAKLQFRSDFVDVCFDTDGIFSMEEVCKILKLDYGRNTMLSKLREKGIFLKSNTPKQELIARGYFKVVETLIDSQSFKKLISTTYATQKGIGFIHKKLDDEKRETA